MRIPVQQAPADIRAEFDAIVQDARTISADVEAMGSTAFFATEDDPWQPLNPRLKALGLDGCVEEEEG